ncbi:hypothetical protein NXS09_02625 [Neisseria sp. CSL10203-ORH2]|uniref:Transmembrane protein n=2 Tax=Neisseria montereyensis TaxID=2973938 RepID=A0ABT2FAM8_9NEIS|nr:hypothetical protein [Neisseria montereyensis]
MVDFCWYGWDWGFWTGMVLVDVVGDVGAGGYLIRPYGGDRFGLCCGMNIFSDGLCRVGRMVW